MRIVGDTSLGLRTTGGIDWTGQYSGGAEGLVGLSEGGDGRPTGASAPLSAGCAGDTLKRELRTGGWAGMNGSATGRLDCTNHEVAGACGEALAYATGSVFGNSVVEEDNSSAEAIKDFVWGGGGGDTLKRELRTGVHTRRVGWSIHRDTECCYNGVL